MRLINNKLIICFNVNKLLKNNIQDTRNFLHYCKSNNTQQQERKLLLCREC